MCVHIGAHEDGRNILRVFLPHNGKLRIEVGQLECLFLTINDNIYASEDRSRILKVLLPHISIINLFLMKRKSKRNNKLSQERSRIPMKITYY
jgi:hypothetical protein